MTTASSNTTTNTITTTPMALINTSSSGSPTFSYTPRFVGNHPKASLRRDMAKVKAFLTGSPPPPKTEEQLARAADRAQRDAILATLPQMQHRTTYYCPPAPRRAERASVREDLNKVKNFFTHSHKERSEDDESVYDSEAEYKKEVDGQSVFSDASTVCDKSRSSSRAREIGSAVWISMNDVGERRQRARASGYY